MNVIREIRLFVTSLSLGLLVLSSFPVRANDLSAGEGLFGKEHIPVASGVWGTVREDKYFDLYAGTPRAGRAQYMTLIKKKGDSCLVVRDIAQPQAFKFASGSNPPSPQMALIVESIKPISKQAIVRVINTTGMGGSGSLCPDGTVLSIPLAELERLRKQAQSEGLIQ